MDNAQILLHVCCGPCSLMPVIKLKEEGWQPTLWFFNPNIQPEAEYLRRREALSLAAGKLAVPVIWDPPLDLPAPMAFAKQEASQDQTAVQNQPPRQAQGPDQSLSQRPTKEAAQSLNQKQIQAQIRDQASKQPSPWYTAAEEAWRKNLAGELRFGKRCLPCYRQRLTPGAQLAARLGFKAFSSSLLYSRYQQHEALRTMGEEECAKAGISFVYRDFRLWWQEGIDLSIEFGLYRQKWCGCEPSRQEALAQRQAREEARKAKRQAKHQAKMAEQAAQRQKHKL